MKDTTATIAKPQAKSKQSPDSAAPKKSRKKPQKKAPEKQPEPDSSPEEELQTANRFGWIRNSPPWLLSTIIHVVIIIALGLLSITTLPEQEFDIVSAFDSEDVTEEIVELSPVDFEMEEIEVEEITPPEAPPIDMSDLMSEAMDSMSPTMDISVNTGLASDLVGEGFGDGLGEGNGNGNGQGQMTSFFGAKSRGDRVVYIVDASNSMNQGRMHTTLMEIMRSVDAMNQKQQFYVIMYSDQAYPMFFPQPVDQMLYANKQNKYKLGLWLNTIETCLGGQVVEAVEMAAELRPQVIYLLSDGRVPTERVEALKEPNNWNFTINTFGMTAPEGGKVKLQSLAKTFNGVYRDVGVNPVAAALAKERPIKRNNKPGGIWGSRIRGGKK